MILHFFSTITSWLIGATMAVGFLLLVIRYRHEIISLIFNLTMLGLGAFIIYVMYRNF